MSIETHVFGEALFPMDVLLYLLRQEKAKVPKGPMDAAVQIRKSPRGARKQLPQSLDE